MTQVIGIASARKHETYAKYILGEDDLEIVRLSYELNNLQDLHRCDAVVLAGGEDVHPRFYGKPGFVEEFGLDDIDEQRDAFEWEILKLSQQKRIPVYGICRGLQIANAFFGGTLVPDVVRSGKPDHTRISKTEDRFHTVQVVAGTDLFAVTGPEGQINSAHHQAADVVAPGFRVCAVSPDGTIEAIERIHPEKYPFIQLVQWHPERMDINSKFSGKLRERFLQSISRH
ncbi:MAG: gamma-glutamyl-gamma-aminobutyrate hydrolase family protein [Cyclobacteriaceae bacterium]|nr:gamma-glutamyl-gamma-aminobutyrate hydrolase family protein [Cyclobacteriaceae bacterium]